MGAASRRKGVTGERAVADTFQAAGWQVRGLEGSGDWLVYAPHRTVEDEDRADTRDPLQRMRHLHVECKRQERLRLPEWLTQAADEAPPGVPPVLVFRQNRGRWYAALPLDDLLELIG